jgi:hypothetical protein
MSEIQKLREEVNGFKTNNSSGDKKSNLNRIKNNFRNKTQNDLDQNNINNIITFSTLNKNKVKSPKKYFLYESENTKENHGIRVFKKKRYNPITDEFIQESNSFNNGYNTIKIKKNEQMNLNEKKQEELIKEEILPEESIKEEENKEKKKYISF